MASFIDADKLYYKRVYIAQPDDSCKSDVVVFAKNIDKLKEQTKLRP